MWEKMLLKFRNDHLTQRPWWPFFKKWAKTICALTSATRGPHIIKRATTGFTTNTQYSSISAIWQMFCKLQIPWDKFFAARNPVYLKGALGKYTTNTAFYESWGMACVRRRKKSQNPRKSSKTENPRKEMIERKEKELETLYEIQHIIKHFKASLISNYTKVTQKSLFFFF